MAAGDITIIEEETFGTQTVIIGTFELPAGVWTAAGVAPGTAKFGLTTVNFCEIEPVEVAADMSTALFAKYDRAGDLVFLYESASGASAEMDATNANVTNNVTDLRFMAIGRR
jgi:hypothetical protein